MLTDSDWGACKRTRKSMCSYAERFGKHLIGASCTKQSVIALSSGEAEFYALVRERLGSRTAYDPDLGSCRLPGYEAYNEDRLKRCERDRNKEGLRDGQASFHEGALDTRLCPTQSAQGSEGVY